MKLLLLFIIVGVVVVLVVFTSYTTTTSFSSPPVFFKGKHQPPKGKKAPAPAAPTRQASCTSASTHGEGREVCVLPQEV